MYSFLLGPIYMTFVFSGFVYAPASHSAVFFNGFLPFLTLLISFIWLKEKISKLQLISVFLILLGAFLILLDGSKLNIGNSWFGDFLFLIAGLLFAIYIVVSKAWKITIPELIFCSAFINFLIYIPIWINFFPKNFSSISFHFEAANSLNNKDIKLSERITVPSNRLRGFEAGRIGPKDGDDFIGGNYSYSINFASNVPQLFEESQNLDFLIFADAADIWGVDYNSSIKGNGIRSSVGVALDWMSPVGPMNFTLAYPLSKKSGDKTESFRFNLGTSF